MMTGGWQTLQSEKVLDAEPWFSVYHEVLLLEDGVTMLPSFYRITARPFAMVFAVTEDGRIPLIEQYKHGAGRQILELPAGYLEAGEDPLLAAQRELLEETGLSAPEWEPLGVYIKDGNRGSGACHAYMARGAVQVAAPDSGDLQTQIVHYATPAALRALWLGGGVAEISTAALIGLGLARLDTLDPLAGRAPTG